VEGAAGERWGVGPRRPGKRPGLRGLEGRSRSDAISRRTDFEPELEPDFEAFDAEAEWRLIQLDFEPDFEAFDTEGGHPLNMFPPNPDAEWEYPVGARLTCDDGVDAVVRQSVMGLVVCERSDGTIGTFYVRPNGALVALAHGDRE
jgi:hypothetical protein